ncbi:MAG: hypothetical protein V7K97_29915 [Nostoc sp.]|uniref:hypothetical protein n=1 Tax=Nostoc sp. TaxID=1180 RepID=UPI002FF6828F
MTTTKSNGEIKLALICLGISLSILWVGTTLPKKESAEGLTICNSSNGDRGYISGIVTSVEKVNGKLNVSITEGTEGCEGLLIASPDKSGKLLPGSRIKAKVNVVQQGMYQLIGDVSVDPTVVNTEGNTEKPVKLEVMIRVHPEFAEVDKYAIFPINVKGEILNLKIDKKKAAEIRYNEPLFVYYYESTHVVTGFEYH